MKKIIWISLAASIAGLIIFIIVKYHNKLGIDKSDMKEGDYTVRRFSQGDKYFTGGANCSHNGALNIPNLKSIFGELLDYTGAHICYTLEREDTLTPEGTYPYSIAYLGIMKMLAPLLSGVPGFSGIFLHIGNYPGDAEGCTMLGTGIDLSTPMLVGSGIAFNTVKDLMTKNNGSVTYTS